MKIECDSNSSAACCIKVTAHSSTPHHKSLYEKHLFQHARFPKAMWTIGLRHCDLDDVQVLFSFSTRVHSRASAASEEELWLWTLLVSCFQCKLWGFSLWHNLKWNISHTVTEVYSLRNGSLAVCQILFAVRTCGCSWSSYLYHSSGRLYI